MLLDEVWEGILQGRGCIDIMDVLHIWVSEGRGVYGVAIGAKGKGSVFWDWYYFFHYMHKYGMRSLARSNNLPNQRKQRQLGKGKVQSTTQNVLHPSSSPLQS